MKILGEKYLYASTAVVMYTVHSHKFTPKGYLPLAHLLNEGRNVSWIIQFTKCKIEKKVRYFFLFSLRYK